MQPIVLHIPHASTEIPADVRSSLLLTNNDLDHELFRLTDHFTDDLFEIDKEVADSVIYPVSRIVCDPERFSDDADESASEVGFGAVYSKTTIGSDLRGPVSENARKSLLERFYAPHHLMLEKTVASSLEQHGYCLIVDCHSFPSDPLPFSDPVSPGGYPDICLGTDAFHTPVDLLQRTRRGFESYGLSVDVDRPFSGTLVPLRYYQSDARVMSLMIEINRDLYMEQASPARKSPGFARVKSIVRSVIISMSRKLQQEAD